MKRILLKLSGEALSAGSGEIYDADFVDKVAEALVTTKNRGYEIALVIGEATSGAADRVLRWTGRRQTVWVCLRP